MDRLAGLENFKSTPMRAKYPASVIAVAFVQLGIRDALPVTKQKLQNLVYIANGVYYGRCGSPLVIEIFEAWDEGPVIQSIYDTFVMYLSEGINNLRLIPSSLRLEDRAKKLDSQACEVIELVWASSTRVPRAWLSGWTRNENSPWKKNYVQGRKWKPILHEDIKEHCLTLLEYYERLHI